jgi:hypothetical protein
MKQWGVEEPQKGQETNSRAKTGADISWRCQGDEVHCPVICESKNRRLVVSIGDISSLFSSPFFIPLTEGFAAKHHSAESKRSICLFSHTHNIQKVNSHGFASFSIWIRACVG